MVSKKSAARPPSELVICKINERQDDLKYDILNQVALICIQIDS